METLFIIVAHSPLKPLNCKNERLMSISRKHLIAVIAANYYMKGAVTFLHGWYRCGITLLLLLILYSVSFHLILHYVSISETIWCDKYLQVGDVWTALTELYTRPHLAEKSCPYNQSDVLGSAYTAVMASISNQSHYTCQIHCKTDPNGDRSHWHIIG